MTLDQAIEQLSDEEAELLLSDEVMLSEFKAKFDNKADLPEGMSGDAPTLKGDLTAGTSDMNVSDQGKEKRLEPFQTAGDYVRGGYAGVGSLAGGNNIQKASGEVNNVLAGLDPETKSGKAGEFLGSFATPIQIALQASGGVAAPYISKGLGAVAKPIVKGMTNISPKLSKFMGVAPETIGRLVDNPQAVKGAKELPKLADEVVSTVKGLGKKGIDAAAAGKAALSDTTAVPGVKERLLELAIKTDSGPLAEKADKAIADYIMDVASKIKDKTSEKEIGMLIESLDAKVGAKWAQANPTAMTAAKEEIRTILSDALQSQNKKYASLMAEAHGTFAPQETLTKGFSLKDGLPSNSTIPALKQALNPNALGTKRALDLMPGMSDSIKDAAAKAALQEAILGRAALWTAPKLDPLVQGSVQAAPFVGNAVYEGLR